jgi:type I restriction enzyme M protein
MNTLFDLPLEREDNLLRIFEEIHNYIYAHDGLSPQEILEEFIKILFIKLYDESNEIHKFYISNNENSSSFYNILELFESIKNQYSDIFERNDKIKLSNNSLVYIINKLQIISLSDSSQDVKGLAFQKFINHHEKSDRGQFFTPEPIINFCVNIISPKKHEIILDPACGSGGFLISTLRYIKENEIDCNVKQIINNNLFGIDINNAIARIAKMKLFLEVNTHNNIISNNSLGPIEKIKSLLHNNNEFDAILTNPPFGAKINQQSLLSTYQLGYKWNKEQNGFFKNGNILNAQTVETLFIERCIDLLKIGGRMAIVLPNGNFENPSLEYIRYYILKKSKILAIVNLPQETFIPYGTGVKTSLLFIEKKEENDIREYPIFLGKITKLGYQGNKNGTPMYKKNSYGQIMSDSNGNQLADENISELIQLYNNYRIGKDFITSHSFSIKSSQIGTRFDFDYYSPDTRNIITNITNSVKLGDICEIVKQKSLKLKIDNGFIDYVELSDINTYSFEIINTTSYNIYELPSRASYELKEGDIITAVAGNSVGTKKHATALVSKDHNGCICTNGFRVLRNFKINPFYLLYYMRTEKYLKQMYMYRTGAAIPVVSDNDIFNIIIEIPEDDIQKKIIDKMESVFLLRTKAKEEFESIYINCVI